MVRVSVLFTSLSLLSKVFAFDNSRFDNVSTVSRPGFPFADIVCDVQVAVYVLLDS